MQFRDDAQHALVAATSMGVRVTPEGTQQVQTADRFFMQATSAESNVVTVSSVLGLPSTVLTAFVEGSPISALIKADLRKRNIGYQGPDRPQGGAWGYRHQFNIADSGFGLRGPRVWNDRAGEVGLTLDVADYDLDVLFGEQGVKVLHLSGLVAALSPLTSTFCLELARAAKRHGTAISFDLNHRASFWKGRETELRAAFTEIAEQADILIGNEEDFQLALGIAGPEAGGEGLAGKLDGFKEMIGRITQRFTGAQVIGTTLREVETVNRHLWGAVVWSGGEFSVAEPREIGVLDRIGGGDGFVGGLLYGLLQGWSAEQAMQFGWATGAMAAASPYDYAQPADEEQVWSVWEGNARVKR